MLMELDPTLEREITGQDEQDKLDKENALMTMQEFKR